MLPPASDPANDPLLAMLDKMLNQLSEHFDSIQIIATNHKGDHTLTVQRGIGNWYSRLGAVTEWLEREKARIHVHTEREIIRENDGDDDDD